MCTPPVGVLVWQIGITFYIPIVIYPLHKKKVSRSLVYRNCRGNKKKIVII